MVRSTNAPLCFHTFVFGPYHLHYDGICGSCGAADRPHDRPLCPHRVVCDPCHGVEVVLHVPSLHDYFCYANATLSNASAE
jgi:hypothetical protein